MKYSISVEKNYHPMIYLQQDHILRILKMKMEKQLLLLFIWTQWAANKRLLVELLYIINMQISFIIRIMQLH